MRIILKIEIPVDIGNKKIKDGALDKTIMSILEEQKPEAAYFITFNGNRCALIVVNIDDTSKMPAIAEPWFLAFNASVEFFPAMVPADLAKAGKDFERIVKMYG
jgi:hypothetical protein